MATWAQVAVDSTPAAPTPLCAVQLRWLPIGVPTALRREGVSLREKVWRCGVLFSRGAGTRSEGGGLYRFFHRPRLVRRSLECEQVDVYDPKDS